MRFCRVAYMIIHLGVSLLYNVRYLLPSVDRTLAQSEMYQRLDRWCKSDWLYLPAQLSGLYGGYGFFGPSVGASYHSFFSVSTTDTELDPEVQRYPGLQSQASKIRYLTMLGLQDGWLRSENEAVLSDFAQQVGTSICRRAQAIIAPDRCMHCQFLAMHTTRLESATVAASKLHYILLYESTAQPDKYDTSGPRDTP